MSLEVLDTLSRNVFQRGLLAVEADKGPYGSLFICDGTGSHFPLGILYFLDGCNSKGYCQL